MYVSIHRFVVSSISSSFFRSIPSSSGSQMGRVISRDHQESRRSPKTKTVAGSFADYRADASRFVSRQLLPYFRRGSRRRQTLVIFTPMRGFFSRSVRFRREISFLCLLLRRGEASILHRDENTFLFRLFRLSLSFSLLVLTGDTLDSLTFDVS